MGVDSQHDMDWLLLLRYKPYCSHREASGIQIYR